MTTNPTPVDVAVAYIEAWARSDMTTVARYLTEHITLAGPVPRRAAGPGRPGPIRVSRHLGRLGRTSAWAAGGLTGDAKDEVPSGVRPSGGPCELQAGGDGRPGEWEEAHPAVAGVGVGDGLE